MVKIGIIGCGPRGLSALESLIKEAAISSLALKVLVFEKSTYPGAGPVYDLDQPDSNWLNVSERAIGIPARENIVFKDFDVPVFPDFQEWAGYNALDIAPDETDRFPLRSDLGKYLYERYRSISNVLVKHHMMTLVKGEVNSMDISDGDVEIALVGGKVLSVQEAVLCIGHQPIALDEQLAGWQNRVFNLDSVSLYTQPYPLDRIVERDINSTERRMAIRGFGLAMIDVLRALTEGRGGVFEVIDNESRKMSYKGQGAEPKEILPFSLDGLPMAPKPLNKKIDSAYVPTNEQLKAYSSHIKKSIRSGTALKSPFFLIKAIAPIIADIFFALGDKTIPHTLLKKELTTIILNWLEDEGFENRLILSKNMPVIRMIQEFIGMATEKNKVSLDFCIGHVWRHCQPTMYKLLSFAPFSDELIGDIVALDERLKRYTYGPPVDSMQQMIALVEAGVVNLEYVMDPKIRLTGEGWKLKKDTNGVLVKTMVNSVLDAPRILKVVSPLPKGLTDRSVFRPVHDNLGIRTQKNAVIETGDLEKGPPLALLGRLAKGTLIGVDAIAECFGVRSGLWAKGVVGRWDNV